MGVCLMGGRGNPDTCGQKKGRSGGGYFGADGGAQSFNGIDVERVALGDGAQLGGARGEHGRHPAFEPVKHLDQAEAAHLGRFYAAAFFDALDARAHFGSNTHSKLFGFLSHIAKLAMLAKRARIIFS